MLPARIGWGNRRCPLANAADDDLPARMIIFAETNKFYFVRICRCFTLETPVCSHSTNELSGLSRNFC
jgi:hypothetical protein